MYLHVIIVSRRIILIIVGMHDYLKTVIANLFLFKILFKIINYCRALTEFPFEKNRCDPTYNAFPPYNAHNDECDTRLWRSLSVKKKTKNRIKPLCRPLRPPIVSVARRSEVLIGSCLRSNIWSFLLIRDFRKNGVSFRVLFAFEWLYVEF